jgi:hypothetical protein
MDGLVVVLTTLAAFIAAFGGFRIHQGPLSFSATDPWRILAIAALLATARHVRVRRPPLHLRLVAGVTNIARSKAARIAGGAWLGSRIAVLSVGYLAVSMIGTAESVPRLSENTFWNLPARAEALRYLSVAMEGYRDRQGAVSNLDIFPAFPFLMRLGGTLLGTRLYVGGTFEDPFLGKTLFAGMLIALAAFLWALVHLYRLALRDLGEAPAAAAVLIAAAHPFAFRFNLVAPDSLLLLVAVAACGCARKGRWLAAACWGGAAGLSHPMGWLTAVPLLSFASAGRRTGSRWLVAAVAPIGGVMAFSVFCYLTTGNPVAWMAPARVAGSPNWSALAVSPLGFFHLVGAAAAVAALPAMWRRLPKAYLAYVLVVLTVAVCRGPASLGPGTAQLFPVFLALGASMTQGRGAGNHLLFAWLPASALMQGFLTAVHYTGRPVL